MVDIDIDVFGEDKAPVLKAGFADYVEYSLDHNNPYETLVSAKRKLNGITTRLYESSNGAKIDLDHKYGENHGNNLTPREVYGFLGELLDQQGLSTERFL